MRSVRCAVMAPRPKKKLKKSASVAVAEQDDEDQAARRVDRFRQWCEQLGADLSGLRIASAGEGRGLCLIAASDIASDEPAVVTPLASLLTVATAARSPIGKALLDSKVAAKGPISSRALLFVVMIHGRDCEDSHWHHYLRSLPSRYTDPLWWSTAKRTKLLAGTQLLHDTATHEEHLRSLHCALFPQLSEEMPDVFPTARYSLEAFLWARSAVSSRCFEEGALKLLLTPASKQSPVKAVLKDEVGVSTAHEQLLLSPSESSKLVADCPAMMVPLIDMGNHDRDAQVHIGLHAAGGKLAGLGAFVVGGVQRDAEIILNYGACRTNLQLLLGRGFCLPGNPVDTVPLRLGSGVGTAALASDIRKQVMLSTGLNPNELHETSRQCLLVPRLLATLRMVMLDEGALRQLVEKHGQPSDAQEKAAREDAGTNLLKYFEQPLIPSPTDPDCELRVLSAMRQCVDQKLKGMRIAGKTDSEKGHAERQAMMYRKGQSDVLKKAQDAIQKAVVDWQREHRSAMEEEGEEGEEEEMEEDAEEELNADEA